MSQFLGAGFGSRSITFPKKKDRESRMFEGFTSFDIPVQSEPSVTIHGIKAGSGPALLLLHGFPQTHHIWHLVAPKLINEFTVIALDLRGYGSSSKPPGGEHHKNYAKSVMARDCVDVMASMGFDKFYVCAHDRGARVAHKLCVDHPNLVHKVILLDICPTLAMYTKTDFQFAKSYFHWFFLIQEAPFPETMILQNPKLFAEYAGLKAFDPECFGHYLEGLASQEGVHAMCEDYRAGSTVDLEEARADISAGRLVQCPLRVLWGAHGVIERCFNALDEWKEVSTAQVDGEKIDCGHFIPEEAPDAVVRNIREWCKGGVDDV